MRDVVVQQRVSTLKLHVCDSASADDDGHSNDDEKTDNNDI